MIRDWKTEIAIAWKVQEETAKLDKSKLWEYFLPKVGATQEELAGVEAALGFTLDSRYREFLSYANGWRCFLQRVDLFGTSELRDKHLMQTVFSMLEEIDTEMLRVRGVARSDLLPIGFSSHQSDIFVLLKSNSPKAGTVIWLAGYEVERFLTFDDFFLAMVDYNRLRFKKLQGDQQRPSD